MKKLIWCIVIVAIAITAWYYYPYNIGKEEITAPVVTEVTDSTHIDIAGEIIDTLVDEDGNIYFVTKPSEEDMHEN